MYPSLIDSLSERFSTDFTIADRLFFDRIHDPQIAGAALKQAAQIN
jgi:hypothetical protein